MTTTARRKVYVDGPGGLRVPFTEVTLSAPEPAVRLYDTSGPGSDPRQGLPPLRREWIIGRGDVVRVRAPSVGMAWTDWLGAPATLTVSDGTPHISRP